MRAGRPWATTPGRCATCSADCEPGPLSWSPRLVALAAAGHQQAQHGQAEQAQAAQDPDHERGLLVGVALAVVGVGAGQAGLDRGVLVPESRIGAERVAEADVLV